MKKYKYRYVNGKFEKVEVDFVDMLDIVDGEIVAPAIIRGLFDEPVKMFPVGLEIESFYENYIKAEIRIRYIKAVTPSGKYRVCYKDGSNDKGVLCTHSQIIEMVKNERVYGDGWHKRVLFSNAKERLGTIKYTVNQKIDTAMYAKSLTVDQMESISDTLEGILKLL